MSRYIDADRLSKEVLSSWDKDNHKTLEASRVHRQEHHHLMHIIEKQPTADMVEVVRCKDCKHYIANYCTRDIKGRTNMFYMTENDFCSYGERREE